MKEAALRNQSVTALEKCIDSDFEKLEGELKEDQSAGEEGEGQLNKMIDDLVVSTSEECENIKKSKQESEESILEMPRSL